MHSSHANLAALERKLKSQVQPKDAIEAFHTFVKPFLYLSAEPEDNNDAAPSTSKWDHSLECFIALYSLKPDGTFEEAKNLMQLFAIHHYYMSGAIAIDCEAKKNFGPLSLSSYNFCTGYQALASSIAYNSRSSPTTWMKLFRAILKHLQQEIWDLLDSLYYSIDLDQLMPPGPVEDDWAKDEHRYSWANNISQASKNAVLKALLSDPGQRLVQPSKDGMICSLNLYALNELA
ncbi:hypothetical protein NLJ89_g12270 [Agrocybe chaxingu]|uniref:Uncharacterized protein n=1 Tax=Agrocybe chaxingu TaxID=84603 RepID=A0A9W8JNF4_9AGAR|nr:hypothetical protein NLJ89_g12270 [Agrocybe chaxingu]